jgi:hypothetical protein
MEPRFHESETLLSCAKYYKKREKVLCLSALHLTLSPSPLDGVVR